MSGVARLGGAGCSLVRILFMFKPSLAVCNSNDGEENVL